MEEVAGERRVISQDIVRPQVSELFGISDVRKLTKKARYRILKRAGRRFMSFRFCNDSSMSSTCTIARDDGCLKCVIFNFAFLLPFQMSEAQGTHPKLMLALRHQVPSLTTLILLYLGDSLSP